ncbi:MAG TPA: hypothetical protein PK498_08760 [Candidatus Kapabacteria bacterium]|nr:hypothetical protein [Candidatus Kapabacteria bacterium]
MKRFYLFILVILLSSAEIFSQNSHLFYDTTFIFTPGRKLQTMSEQMGLLNNAGGIDLLFSNSGFGFGGFINIL